MGQGFGLPKAVESIVVERHASKLFRFGLAEMNGWRPAMEDSHVAVMRDNWGFFGVFDGHGGSQCSAFVARRLTEELTKGPLPPDDAAVKSIMLKLDQEFLDLKQPSGSTGTFAFVQPPAQGEDGGGRFTLRVGNIGDSRVLLGKADGTLVEGPGTDGGLTTDHKPDLDSEMERINRTGGTVQMVQGVARVNGDLAVSRAFGDAPHKKTGGPKQEDHPVSAEPEFTTVSCDASDFLVLVCDGISEGTFPNREVVKLAAEKLKDGSEGGAAPDLGAVCAAVCRQALEAGSTDNLSCMVVQLSGEEAPAAEPKHEFLAGPFVPDHGEFRRVYAFMAERAGLSLAKAVELRYDTARKERVEAMARRPGAEGEGEGQAESGERGQGRDSRLNELRSEIALFGEGPPSELQPGCEERTQWFEKWLASHEVERRMDPSNMSRAQLLSMLAQDPEMLAMAQQQGLVADAVREVQVAPLEELKPAVEAHPALKWDTRLAGICGQRGRVLKDDPSDGTSQVNFPPPMNARAWLPTSALHDVEEEAELGRLVRVAPEGQLRPAVEEISALNWYNEMAAMCGNCGHVVQADDGDGTTQVKFPPPLDITAWLPTACLEDAEEDDEGDGATGSRRARAPELGRLRSAVEEHPALKWHEQLEKICGETGRILQDDDSDGTSQVSFGPPINVTVWLPTEILIGCDEPEAELEAGQEEAKKEEKSEAKEPDEQLADTENAKAESSEASGEKRPRAEAPAEEAKAEGVAKGDGEAAGEAEAQEDKRKEGDDKDGPAKRQKTS